MYQARIFLFVALFFHIAIAAQSFAAGKQLRARPAIDPAKLNESFDDAKVSTGVFVGYRVGKFNSYERIRPFLVSFPASTSKLFCLSLRTNDARFVAENIYQVELVPDGISPVEVSPVTNKFTDELSKYRRPQLAVSAFQTKDGSCNPVEAVYFPQLGKLTGIRSEIQVLINSESRSAVIQVLEIIFPDGMTKRLSNHISPCSRIEALASVALDTTCPISHEEQFLGNQIRISIDLNDGFGIEPHTFILYVPAL